jgi:hypothetical protein
MKNACLQDQKNQSEAANNPQHVADCFSGLS